MNKGLTYFAACFICFSLMLTVSAEPSVPADTGENTSVPQSAPVIPQNQNDTLPVDEQTSFIEKDADSAADSTGNTEKPASIPQEKMSPDAVADTVLPEKNEENGETAALPLQPDTESSVNNQNSVLPNDEDEQTTEDTAGFEETVRSNTGKPVKDMSRRSRIVRQFAGGVSAIADSAATRSFFAAGKDGFITRYTYGRLLPETWQVSALPIKCIAVHPKKNYIAVYETDGFSVHNISLWDWQTKKRLYIKRFHSSVLSLGWSAQGSYLFIGTASTEGITVLDVRGNVKKIYPRPPGIVLLAATGPSEKSIVTYGETGRLVYADVAKRSILTQYETEDRLQNPELIKNYTRIIGYKNGTVFVIKAASGEILESYPARSALFAGKMSDTQPVWIEEGEKRFTWHICRGTKKSPDFTLPHKARITAARHLDSAIVIGTDDGRLYRLQQGADELISLTEINHTRSLPVNDICVKDTTVYMLAGDTLYAADSPDEQPQPLITDIAAERCTPYGTGFLFWSDNKTAPLYYAEEGSSPLPLYRPREPLNSVAVYGDTLTLVHSFSGLLLLDAKNGKKRFEYQAAGLQDAVQIDNNFVLVSKTGSGSVLQPLLLINTATSETIPLGLEGSLAFSLRANTKMKDSFSCLRIRPDNSAQTDMITMKINSLHPASSTFRSVLSHTDEDVFASLYDDGTAVVTNLGREQIVYYDKNRRKVQRLMRDYALPRRTVLTASYIIGLNYDGSLSWFQRRTMQLMESAVIEDPRQK